MDCIHFTARQPSVHCAQPSTTAVHSVSLSAQYRLVFEIRNFLFRSAERLTHQMVSRCVNQPAVMHAWHSESDIAAILSQHTHNRRHTSSRCSQQFLPSLANTAQYYCSAFSAQPSTTIVHSVHSPVLLQCIQCTARTTAVHSVSTCSSVFTCSRADSSPLASRILPISFCSTNKPVGQTIRRHSVQLQSVAMVLQRQ